MSTNQNLPLPDDVSSSPMASDAALIATFYYQHNLAHPLTSQEAANHGSLGIRVETANGKGTHP